MVDIGLNLVWYKYLIFIGKRMLIKGFEYGRFVRENLFY